MTTTEQLGLSPAARKVFDFAHANSRGVSAVDALMSLDGMTSASLARRIVEIERAGYQVTREPRRHPTTGRRYTRYHVATIGG